MTKEVWTDETVDNRLTDLEDEVAAIKKWRDCCPGAQPGRVACMEDAVDWLVKEVNLIINRRLQTAPPQEEQTQRGNDPQPDRLAALEKKLAGINIGLIWERGRIDALIKNVRVESKRPWWRSRRKGGK